jgi:hypothetical protein
VKQRRLTDKLLNQRPTAATPVAFIRTSANDFVIRVPIVNGSPTNDFTQFVVKNKNIGGNMLNLASMYSYEDGVVRCQSDFSIHGAVWEYAHNVGLTTDPLGPLWGFQGNDHGNVVSTGLTISMDGGGDLSGIAIGLPVLGTSLVITQSYSSKLPKNPATTFGTISDIHTFNSSGCTVDVIHTPTLANAGNQDSYSCTFPFTGLNRGQFGNGSVLDVTPVNTGQGLDQGQQSIFKGWHTDRPDLFAEAILVNGNPGSPDIWTNVTTPNTMIVNNTGYSKAYFSYRSGSSVLAAVTSTHKSLYRLRK